MSHSKHEPGGDKQSSTRGETFRRGFLVLQTGVRERLRRCAIWRVFRTRKLGFARRLFVGRAGQPHGRKRRWYVCAAARAGLNFQVNGRDYLVPMCRRTVGDCRCVECGADGAGRRWFCCGSGPAADDRPGAAVRRRTRRRARRRFWPKSGADVCLQRCAAQLGAARWWDAGHRGADAGTVDCRRRRHAGGPLDCRLLRCDGANLVNTVAEAVAPRFRCAGWWLFWSAHPVKLADRRCVRVRCRVPVDVLRSERFDGGRARRIVLASRFAELDPTARRRTTKGS